MTDGSSSNLSIPGSDLNLDGTSDILWRNTLSGHSALWSMGETGLSGSSSLPSLSPLWEIAAAADFSQDGHSDILWQNSITGSLLIAELDDQNNPIKTAVVGQMASNSRVAGIGDFNGDNQTDILIANQTTGALTVWYMDGTIRLAGEPATITTRPAAWQVKATGDFDGDGQDDLVWSNQRTGQVEIWLMDGLQQKANTSPMPLQALSPTWELRGSGDFNKNGQTDLVWWNKVSGSTIVWFMEGTSFETSQNIGFVSPSWQPIAQASRNLQDDGTRPDLRIQNVVMPTTVVDGGTVNITVDVINQGPKASPGTILKYYLSNDNLLGEGDPLLGEVPVGSIVGDQSTPLSFSFIYDAATMGNDVIKYIIFVADADKTVVESDEENNTFTQGFIAGTVTEGLVDLDLDNIVLPSRWIVGTRSNVTVDLLNIGNDNARSSTVTLYLSDSSTLDESAIPIESQTVTNLGGTGLVSTGEKVSLSFNFDYLEKYGEGPKNVFFVVTSLGDSDVEPANNTLSQSINVVPNLNIDLAITTASAPDKIVIGQPLSVSATVLNQGIDSLPSSISLSVYVTDYVSEEDEFNANAVFVGTVPITALEPNTSDVVSLNPRYSISGVGQKNLFFVIDPSDAITELDETNNVFKTTILVEEPEDIDLVVRSASPSSTSITPGVQGSTSVSIDVEVENIGITATSNSFMVRAYLSNDGETYDPSSGSIWGTEFAAGFTGISPLRNFTYNYAPADGVGTVYIHIVVDDENTVFETNEVTNVRVVPLTINEVQNGIDLVVTEASVLSETIVVGQEMTVSFTVQNQGNTASGVTTLGIYASSDNSLDDGDILIRTLEIPNLGTYGSHTQTRAFEYLEEYGLEGRTILVVADPLDAVTEAKEDNNLKALPITALPDTTKPDLVISQLDFLSATTLEVFNVRYYVKNQGELATDQSFKIAFYLSNESITNINDIATKAVFLNEDSVPVLIAEGSNYTSLIAIEPPTNDPEVIWSPGLKYLVVVADYDNLISESNEGNNISSYQFTLES